MVQKKRKNNRYSYVINVSKLFEDHMQFFHYIQQRYLCDI